MRCSWGSVALADTRPAGRCAFATTASMVRGVTHAGGVQRMPALSYQVDFFQIQPERLFIPDLFRRGQAGEHTANPLIERQVFEPMPRNRIHGAEVVSEAIGAFLSAQEKPIGKPLQQGRVTEVAQGQEFSREFFDVDGIAGDTEILPRLSWEVISRLRIFQERSRAMGFWHQAKYASSSSCNASGNGIKA